MRPGAKVIQKDPKTTREVSGDSKSGSDRVETQVGDRVIETPRRVYNPVTDQFQNMESLSEDGYCRRFLAVLSAISVADSTFISPAPTATFSKDEWELEEDSDEYVLSKTTPQTKRERVLGDLDD